MAAENSALPAKYIKLQNTYFKIVTLFHNLLFFTVFWSIKEKSFFIKMFELDLLRII